MSLFARMSVRTVDCLYNYENESLSELCKNNPIIDSNCELFFVCLFHRHMICTIMCLRKHQIISTNVQCMKLKIFQFDVAFTFAIQIEIHTRHTFMNICVVNSLIDIISQWWIIESVSSEIDKFYDESNVNSF